EVVRTLVGEGEARNAEANFSKVHQAHEAPSDMPKFKARGASLLVDVLAGSGLVASKTDARRQIEQGGVKVDGKAVKDVNATVKAGMVVQKGKRHFIRLV
ncbi:MAG TPA: S4 domain-containing protein, partial [Candidatus Methylomirabilis sp.]|nr:S4 domain-containing protein [Candidatus Methylomirabilis sp.]